MVHLQVDGDVRGRRWGLLFLAHEQFNEGLLFLKPGGHGILAYWGGLERPLALYINS